MGRIVVGVDGSEHAARALRTALEEARRREASLDVVHAVEEPVFFADPVLVPPLPREELYATGLAVIEQALTTVETDGVEIRPLPEVGHVADVLCRVAEGAELLVVGSRGLGGFRGLLVGSVTQQVVAHAPCPILVVVPERAKGSKRR